MKIFSSFDTKLLDEKKKYYSGIYGAENVLVLRKSKLFFTNYVLMPILLGIIICIALLYGIFLITNKNIGITMYVGTPLTVIILGAIIYHNARKNYIDYTMDFCIVTPKEVEKYDQTGILQRDINALASEKIKSVKTNKKGFFYSVFNNGEIIFMSEGDTAQGEIYLEYIQSPETAKKKIIKLMKKGFNI